MFDEAKSQRGDFHARRAPSRAKLNDRNTGMPPISAACHVSGLIRQGSSLSLPLPNPPPKTAADPVQRFEGIMIPDNLHETVCC